MLAAWLWACVCLTFALGHLLVVDVDEAVVDPAPAEGLPRGSLLARHRATTGEHPMVRRRGMYVHAFSALEHLSKLLQRDWIEDSLGCIISKDHVDSP